MINPKGNSVVIPLIDHDGNINPYCGTDSDSSSNYLTFKYWEKDGYRRIYASDYKRRSVGYIDCNHGNRIVSEYSYGEYIETMKYFRKKYKLQGGKIMTTRKIYGVSSKFDFGKWDHVVYVFDNKVEAERWLNTPEYDFREREIMTKTAAIQLAGRRAVNNAIEA